VSGVFADSYYFLGLINTRDDDHRRCAAFASEYRGKVLTTEYVLLEFYDGLAVSTRRAAAIRFGERLTTVRDVEILPGSSDYLRRGLDLYKRRTDKDWSLTDCISFVVMRERGLIDALTADHHFEQAGFRALLKENP
jgi:uncharacterized protein